MSVQTASDFDADFVDRSMSFPLPSEMEEIGSNEADDLRALKMSGLAAPRGAMVAIAMELAIPLFLSLVWYCWHSWR